MEDQSAAKPVILVTSFGTTYNNSRHITIGAIESDIREAFPGYEVRRAFTAKTVMERLYKRDGRKIESIDEAMTTAASEGVSEIIVQPTHIMNGGEYDKIARAVKAHEGAFKKCAIGAPLLTSDNDYDRVIDALCKELAQYDDGQTCIVLVGHGTDAESNRVYAKLQDKLNASGHENYIVCTVEAKPDFDDAVKAAKKGGYRRAVLRIFMVVAGDHATNDMAGDEDDSLKSRLVAEGLEVTAVTAGLGQLVDIDEIYVNHVRAAIG